MMIMPCVFRMSAALDSPRSKTWGMLGKLGIVLQIVGVSVEGIADYQKGSFKRLVGCRDRWCNVGLWKFSTHPNYLGEVIFWIGTYVGGIATYSNLNRWILSTFGLVFVAMVIQNASKSLSAKQYRKYSFDEDYVDFRRTHSIFGPLPRKTLSNIRI